ncbi:hypothetical protein EVAR_78357_1 [Eumeta japonica]|uniref:Uncharacterized protein n=1 Tax=Eumeta variegata TaxID=151549 RepID=A0A4C1T4H3_EUMVA|nr:hypothetical protein EVAR_78357_1 [Eumeta japonica]
MPRVLKEYYVDLPPGLVIGGASVVVIGCNQLCERAERVGPLGPAEKRPVNPTVSLERFTVTSWHGISLKCLKKFQFKIQYRTFAFQYIIY